MLTILSFPNCKYRVSFFLFRSSLISFSNSFLIFPCAILVFPLLNVFLNILFFLILLQMELPFFFLGLHFFRVHMEIPRLGVELELQLPAYTTPTTPNLSHIFDLHHSSQQCCIFNPWEARDLTCVLIDTSQVHFGWAITGTPGITILILIFELFIPSLWKYDKFNCNFAAFIY